MVLQIIIKVINNLIGFNGLILTLLIFGAYFRIISENVLLLLIIKRTKVIRVIIKEIRCFYVKR